LAADRQGDARRPRRGKLEVLLESGARLPRLPAEKAWPGDEFVDYVGIDVYDDSWAKETYPWPADTSADQIAARQKKVWKEVIFGAITG